MIRRLICFFKGHAPMIEDLRPHEKELGFHGDLDFYCKRCNALKWYEVKVVPNPDKDGILEKIMQWKEIKEK